jgi:hypothetical protein
MKIAKDVFALYAKENFDCKSPLRFTSSPNIPTPNCIHVAQNGYEFSRHMRKGDVRYVGRTYLAFCDATNENFLKISTGAIRDSHF